MEMWVRHMGEDKDGLDQEKSVMKMEMVNNTQGSQHSEDTVQNVLWGPMWMLSMHPSGCGLWFEDR